MTPQQKDLILGALLIGDRYAMQHLAELKHYNNHGQPEVMGRLDKIRAAIKELEAMPTTTKEVKND